MAAFHYCRLLARVVGSEGLRLAGWLLLLAGLRFFSCCVGYF